MFPSCIARIIADYAKENVLQNWLNGGTPCWKWLSRNPAAISIVEDEDDNHCDSIPWKELSLNYAAAYLLEDNYLNGIEHEEAKDYYPIFIDICNYYEEKVFPNQLARNPAVIFLPENNSKYMKWEWLSANPAAISILRDNPDRIVWEWLSYNPAAISLLEKNMKKINWLHLSANSAAVYTIENNQRRMSRYFSCENTAAIHMVENDPPNICWRHLSHNPAALHLLRDNKYESRIFSNPAAFRSNGYDIYKQLIQL